METRNTAKKIGDKTSAIKNIYAMIGAFTILTANVVALIASIKFLSGVSWSNILSVTVPLVSVLITLCGSLEEIAKYVSDDLNTYVVDECVPKYICDCSKERIERALFSMGKKDILELSNDEITEVTCHFCNKKYHFTKDEILKLVDLKKD